MNRTVTFKGEKIKIAYIKNSEGFVINGKQYPVKFETNEIICRNGSNGLAHYQTYNGVRIPENDKKILEMIIELNGI